ncbi:MAG: hypothetical protein HN390_11425 [Anaerolineae bacterium]|jgi:hypothetical protein|nr:hypothetical protein [Anaerolineae bacterium]MBT7190959.1 hypothetical protein [Anaerolineae bacterium]
MYKKRWLFLVLVFVLALTTACGGGASAPAPVEEAPAIEEAAPPAAEEAPAQEEAPPAAEMESDFPLPEDVDVSTVIDLGDGAINFQTTLTLPDAVTFYRFAFADLGYVERDINTSIEDTTFSMIFDGHANGKAIVIQGVDLGESVNINIRFEDV